jgi:uncharacterized membrane protein
MILLSLHDAVLGVNDSGVCRARGNHLLRLQSLEPVGFLIALMLAAMYYWCAVLALILVVGIIVVIILMFNRSQFHLAQNMVLQCQSLSHVAAHATFLGQ